MTIVKPSAGSVFLVEDEAMIRMMVVDMLEELGFSVAAETGEIDEAIKLAGTTDFDIAILDVNVNGRVISPVADLLKARKVIDGLKNEIGYKQVLADERIGKLSIVGVGMRQSDDSFDAATRGIAAADEQLYHCPPTM